MDKISKMMQEILDNPNLKYSYPVFLDSKCECGKDKHNFTRHSIWCPKYED